MRRFLLVVSAGAALGACVLGVDDVSAVAAPANLVHNGSFESGLAPWKAWRMRFGNSPNDGAVKVARVAATTPAPGGGKHAARVTLVSGKCNEASWACGIGIQQLGDAKWTNVNDEPCYVASAFVRAANAATVGKVAQVTIPEYNGKRLHSDSYGNPVKLISTWQQVAIDPITIEQLDDTIGVKVEVDGAKAGNAFDVDVVSLRQSAC